jgi:hypothetical protein
MPSEIDWLANNQDSDYAHSFPDQFLTAEIINVFLVNGTPFVSLRPITAEPHKAILVCLLFLKLLNCRI